jgi:hypothetical protein
MIACADWMVGVEVVPEDGQCDVITRINEIFA